MKALKHLLVTVFLLATQLVMSQARFVSTGRIEFEKKINMYKWLEDNSWTREMKEKFPTYHVSYHDLLFDSTRSVYKTGKEAPDDKWKNMWFQNGSEENVILNDFASGVSSALKQVLEKKFLVEDSLVQIEWRITDETRTIAGFDCRKAVGKMFDSLYVVAFYTDQIILPAGPELYNGLPGMILGLAFPRYYTTWFATKVELTMPGASAIALPANKAKKISRKELFNMAKVVMEWGTPEEKQKSFWSTVL